MAMDRGRNLLSAENYSFSGFFTLTMRIYGYLLSAERFSIFLPFFRSFIPYISAYSSYTYITHRSLWLTEKTMLKNLSAVAQHIQQLIGSHSLTLRWLWWEAHRGGGAMGNTFRGTVYVVIRLKKNAVNKLFVCFHHRIRERITITSPHTDSLGCT